jgi:hypothetical protein
MDNKSKVEAVYDSSKETYKRHEKKSFDNVHIVINYSIKIEALSYMQAPLYIQLNKKFMDTNIFQIEVLYKHKTYILYTMFELFITYSLFLIHGKF